MVDGRRGREHAVVIGGSMAGLVGARVLAERFEKVTVIERDPRPEGPEARKATPQARHVHALLEAGMKGLRALFPGLVEELRGAGALLVDAALTTAWHQCGAWKPRFASGIDIILLTRPLLEHHVRRRVEALPNVEIRYEHGAEELLSDRGRVTGARIRGAGGEEALSADLVLDAAGRGTRAPRWLEALGYGRPEEDQVVVDIAYTTRLYERPADHPGDFRALMISARAPATRRTGFLFEVEGGRWIASLNGCLGDHPPTDEQGFLDFARSLEVPEIYEAIKGAKPASPLSTHKVPSSRWMRYDKMARFPEGLLLLGDSVCALNPVYGQGMTVAVMCAMKLRERLMSAGPGGAPGAFQREIADVIAVPWLLSTAMDLRYPEVKGRRPPGHAAMHWAFERLIEATAADVRACKLFYEVIHMRRGMAALAQPGLLLPFLGCAARSLIAPPGRRGSAPGMPRSPSA